MNNCQNGYTSSRMPVRCGNPTLTNMKKENYCECNMPDRCMLDTLRDFPIAMAYVPWQEWRDLYDLEEGFKAGTIFKELDKPFMGRRCSR